MGLQARVLALPLELRMMLWMRGLSTVPEEIGGPHQGQVSGVHVGHVAEGGQVSQVLDQVFQRSVVVSYEERKKCQVTDAHPLRQHSSDPALTSQLSPVQGRQCLQWHNRPHRMGGLQHQHQHLHGMAVNI